MNSLLVQTAIGLILVFAIFAVFVSVITEALTRFIGLRGEYLLRGLRTLLDGGGRFTLFPEWLLRLIGRSRDGEPSKSTSLLAMAAGNASAEAARTQADEAWVSRVVNHPLVQVSTHRATVPDKAGNARLTRRQRRRLPSYVSGEVFARTLIDLLVPDSAGHTTMFAIRNKIRDVSPAPLRQQLLSLAGEVGEDVAAFRTSLAGWYDAHMDRVSGWYKRHVRWISLGIGVVLVLLFNLNVLSIARELYTDQGVRTAIVHQAAGAVQCKPANAKQCLTEVQRNLNAAELAGLPIGWRTVTACPAPSTAMPVTARVQHLVPASRPPAPCTNVLERTGLIDAGAGFWHNVGVFLLVVLGWALMVVALLPGARFWFDILGRLGTLRSTGPKPRKTVAV